MRESIIKVYTFSELSEKAKRLAINNFSDINVGYKWWESGYEDAENIGLKIEEFDYVKAEFIEGPIDCIQKIFKEHGSQCDTYQTAMVYEADLLKAQKNLDKEDTTVEEEEWFLSISKEFLRDLSNDYRIMLRKEYEYLTSEEAIIETIEANEYEFTEDGKLF